MTESPKLKQQLEHCTIKFTLKIYQVLLLKTTYQHIQLFAIHLSFELENKTKHNHVREIKTKHLTLHALCISSNVFFSFSMHCTLLKNYMKDKNNLITLRTHTTYLSLLELVLYLKIRLLSVMKSKKSVNSMNHLLTSSTGKKQKHTFLHSFLIRSNFVCNVRK